MLEDVRSFGMNEGGCAVRADVRTVRARSRDLSERDEAPSADVPDHGSVDRAGLSLRTVLHSRALADRIAQRTIVSAVDDDCVLWPRHSADALRDRHIQILFNSAYKLILVLLKGFFKGKKLRNWQGFMWPFPRIAGRKALRTCRCSFSGGRP